MKSLVTYPVTISILMCVFVVAPVNGTILRLSDYSSEDEHLIDMAKYLDAELDFSVVGHSLTLSVTNLTPESTGDPRFKINRIYFNVTDNVEKIILTDVTGPADAVDGWDLGFSRNGFLVGGFGHFDVYLKGGHGSHQPVVNPGQTISFAFEITGAGPFRDNDFVTLSSPQGGHIIPYAAAKFYNDCTSAFGATNVPEPATVSLLVGGLILLRKRSRR